MRIAPVDQSQPQWATSGKPSWRTSATWLQKTSPTPPAAPTLACAVPLAGMTARSGRSSDTSAPRSKWAERSGLILKAPAIERPPKPPPKDRHLTRDEAERLLAAAIMPHVRLFIILAITTAARASALLELTWDRCDVERGRIYLGNPETIRPLKGRATVPMNDTARAALAAAREGARTAYVIEWAGDRVRKIHGGVVTAARRAGLAGVTPHVLRHTAAVWMAEHGTPMSEIAQYLGHADSRITERVYSRFSPEYLRKAAAALELAGPHSVNRLATGSRKPLT